MRSLLTLVWLSVLLSSANAQHDPKNHNAFNGLKEIAFHDDFDDDRNNWFVLNSSPTDTSDVEELNDDKTAIENGIFRIATTGMNNNHFDGYEITTDIDYNRNFDITIRAKVSKQNDDPGTGILYWGREINTVNGYNLYIQQDGIFVLFYSNIKHKNFIEARTFKKKEINCTYHKDDFNKYTIRKYLDRYYVFVNDVYQCRKKAVTINGTILGLGGAFNTDTQFDYITVTYLP